MSSNSSNNNPPNLDALAALYGNFGASPNQNGGAASAAAASFAAPTSVQAPTGGPSSSSFDMQSLYAQQVQQLTAAQQAAVQQQQQAHSQANLLSSLPPSLLQAYLASMTSQSAPAPGISGLSSLLGTNTLNLTHQQTQQQTQQQHQTQAQAFAAQLLASSQMNPGAGAQLSLSPSHNGVASMLQRAPPSVDLMGAMVRAGSTSGLGSVASGPAPGLIDKLQAAAQSKQNTSPSSDLSAGSLVAVDVPATSKSSKAAAKSSKRSSSSHPKKRRTSSSGSSASDQTDPTRHTPNAVISEWEDKKLAKRAANRLSAHLSRKRKKMFIDDLTTENTDLRRKVQILQSIPDLIVVFDSSGWISFISQSVSTLLGLENRELKGTSFWDHLTDDSVKLIKSAFMDALAEKRRQSEDDSNPLCNGESISVRLVDKNGGQEVTKVVSLRGVVHFTGDAPECVCSIRPIENESSISHDDYNEAEVEEKVTNKIAVANGRAHEISDVESSKTSK